MKARPRIIRPWTIECPKRPAAHLNVWHVLCAITGACAIALVVWKVKTGDWTP